MTAGGGAAQRRLAAEQRARHARRAPPEQRRRHGMHGGDTEISCCVKYSVFGFNVLFFILGAALLLIGIWAQLEKNSLVTQLNRASRLYLDPTWALVAVGLLTFAIGFSGCVGSLRENTSFLSFYSSLLGLLFISECAVAFFAYAYKDEVDAYMTKMLDDVIVGYRDDPDLQVLIDTMQESWRCCGVNEPDDWDRNSYFSRDALDSQSPEAGGVPFSCCINGSSSTGLANYFCGHGARLRENEGYMASRIYTEGCLPQLQLWIHNNITVVGVTLMVVAIIQIFGICFAQSLKSDIYAQRAKWYRRH